MSHLNIHTGQHLQPVAASTECEIAALGGRLRAATLADLPQLQAAVGHPSFPTMLPLRQHWQQGSLATWLQRFAGTNQEGMPILWSLDLPDHPCAAQICALPRAGEQDLALSYWLHPTFWRQGLLSTALAALLAHLARNWDQRRYWAACSPDNLASAALLRKLGFTQIPGAGPSYTVHDQVLNTIAFQLQLPA